jgi:hypothetical protein
MFELEVRLRFLMPADHARVREMLESYGTLAIRITLECECRSVPPRFSHVQRAGDPRHALCI